MRTNYYIGWDVGGWNCDKNGKSRDAIEILDEELKLVGTPWRGNLRESINESNTTDEFIAFLFELCKAGNPQRDYYITMGIDTPLGFSYDLKALISGLQYTEPILESASNPYLYRKTERYLFEHGLRPLSAIKDMIGSQATKGIHVLAKFAPYCMECGVWHNNNSLTAVEAYPSACKQSMTIKELQSHYQSLGHSDKDDALTCALIAYLFVNNRELLASPPVGTLESEGWIWVPKDGLTWL